MEYFTDLKDKIRRAGRRLTPFHPTRGAAVVFSSGWENMHEVESITSGVRYAVPCFFTTSPVPDVAYEQMVQGRPKTDEDIADDWLHLLLAHSRYIKALKRCCQGRPLRSVKASFVTGLAEPRTIRVDEISQRRKLQAAQLRGTNDGWGKMKRE